MITVPNQKIITIKKAKCDVSNLFALINLDSLEKAARNLKAGEFKLWIYFAKNQAGYKFALSSSDAKKRFWIGKRQYDKGIHELISKGYLQQAKNGSMEYYFIEDPDRSDELLTKFEKKDSIKIEVNQSIKTGDITINN